MATGDKFMRKECYGKVSVEGILFVSTAHKVVGLHH